MPSGNNPVPPHLAGAWLTINLDAVAENWRRLAGEAPDAGCAAVVKADGYGLGAAQVAGRLSAEGCRTFFVAHPAEGIALRPHVPDAAIYVLNGLLPGADGDYQEHGLAPVLNTRAQVDAWIASADGKDPGPAALHIDTGITRLGLSPADASALAAETDGLAALPELLVMSHLACADTPDHDLNGKQLAAFRAALEHWPGRQACLANSSGVFLGADYHFDLLRPGVAIYGGNPTPGVENPMLPVVTLSARILQLQSHTEPRTVGYGATWRAKAKARIATIAVGYADGLWRALSNGPAFRLAGYEVPVVGRVSMDLITVDVTDVPESLLTEDARVDLLDDEYTVDDLAAAADTIGYEVLTSLGRRYHRTYVDAASTGSVA